MVGHKRYFAIVVEANAENDLIKLWDQDGVTGVASGLYEFMRDGDTLPSGTRMTRVIEITEKHAKETWV